MALVSCLTRLWILHISHETTEVFSYVLWSRCTVTALLPRPGRIGSYIIHPLLSKAGTTLCKVLTNKRMILSSTPMNPRPDCGRPSFFAQREIVGIEAAHDDSLTTIVVCTSPLTCRPRLAASYSHYLEFIFSVFSLELSLPWRVRGILTVTYDRGFIFYKSWKSTRSRGFFSIIKSYLITSLTINLSSSYTISRASLI